MALLRVAGAGHDLNLLRARGRVFLFCCECGGAVVAALARGGGFLWLRGGGMGSHVLLLRGGGAPFVFLWARRRGAVWTSKKIMSFLQF